MDANEIGGALTSCSAVPPLVTSLEIVPSVATALDEDRSIAGCCAVSFFDWCCRVDDEHSCYSNIRPVCFDWTEDLRS